MPETTSMRLDDETKRLIDELCEYLQVKSKAAIVKLAVRRMARAELGAVAPPPVKIPAPTPSRSKKPPTPKRKA